MQIILAVYICDILLLMQGYCVFMVISPFLHYIYCGRWLFL